MADVIGGIVAELSVDATVDVGLQKARQAMAALEAEANRLQRELDQGILTTAQYTVKTKELAAAQTQLGTAMQAAYTRTAASSSAVAVALNGTAVGGMNAAMKMTILGQAMDDAQYGFSAIVNQSGQIAAALGMGAGVGGAAMVAGVMINQLIKHWDYFTKLIGMGAVETAAEEMTRLEKATARTADEQERLNKLKSREATHKEVVEMRTPEEEATTAGMKKAISEAGGRDVLKALLEREQPWHKMGPEDAAELAEAKARDARLKERRARHEVLDPTDVMLEKAKGTEQEILKRIQEKLGGLTTEAVDKLLDDAIKGTGIEGENARKALEGIVKGNKAFAPGLAGDIRSATPEGRREDEQRALDAKGREQGRKLAEEAARKNSAAIDKQTDEMLKSHKEVEKDRAKERGKTMEELMVQEEMAEYDQSVLATIRSPRELAKRADLEERRGDLDWRMKLLMNPERVGQSMGAAAYEQSFKATSGLSEEEKQTHAILELLKEQEKNARALEKLADVKVVATAKP